MKIFFSFLMIVVVLTFSGCFSAKKGLEEASDLTSQGRYAEAAMMYVKVLEKEPTWNDARMKLRSVGGFAIEGFVGSINSGGSAIYVADLYTQIDDLVAAASTVGERLSTPADYNQKSRSAYDNAIENVVTESANVARAGRHRQAIEMIDTAFEKYHPGPHQVQTLNGAKGNVLVNRAQAELDKNRFKKAHQYAIEALEIPRLNRNLSDQANRIVGTALELGTVHVAILPVWRTNTAAENMPATFLQDLNDGLELDFWTSPPAFVGVANPVEVRREMRRMRLNNRQISDSDAIEAARVFEANYVVVSEVEKYESVEDTRKTERVSAKTKRGVDVEYVLRHVRLTQLVEISVAIIDTRTGRVVREETVKEDEYVDYKQGSYAGNAEALDLGRRERRYFDVEAISEEKTGLEEALLTGLIEEMAKDVFRELLRQVD